MGNGFSVAAIPQWYVQWGKYYGKNGFLMASQSKAWDTTDLKDLAGKIMVITGANSGIGLEVSKELARRKASVHMLCRNLERGEAAKKDVMEVSGNKEVFLHVVDVADSDSVRSFCKSFLQSYDKVDVLVNNAGILATGRHESDQGVESCFATAMGGTVLLSGLLLPALKKAAPSVVINVSSAGMFLSKCDVSDLNMMKRKKYDGMLQYSRVKRAQVELSEIWAEKLKDTGVCVHAMHPGYAVTPGVQTLPGLSDGKPGGFFEEHGPKLRSAAEGADTIVWLASAPKARECAGLLWFDRRTWSPHFTLAGTSLAHKERDALWEGSLKLMGATWVDGAMQ
eukprot:CAMPEP_0206246072 /NCGR_PEP_ID=MMETSP0047_2-20121206/19049_1 /ASSEMBLY_ACC=CAM_ASM_000192 /TAXON_ID=195065 /ORGANISM="Chroomonas mesostigmatica_cf, Strain CCMP1168" /LENGTH=338 /DNA_ID=CAMNT_0053671441 /DNA_START=18 /DNA_END=1034 /DNA_ORIENTATION=-